MSDAPDKLFAWPSGAFNDWYAAGASNETTLVYEETEYIRKDIYDALQVKLELAIEGIEGLLFDDTWGVQHEEYRKTMTILRRVKE